MVDDDCNGDDEVVVKPTVPASPDHSDVIIAAVGNDESCNFSTTTTTSSDHKGDGVHGADADKHECVLQSPSAKGNGKTSFQQQHYSPTAATVPLSPTPPSSTGSIQLGKGNVQCSSKPSAAAHIIVTSATEGDEAVHSQEKFPALITLNMEQSDAWEMSPTYSVSRLRPNLSEFPETSSITSPTLPNLDAVATTTRSGVSAQYALDHDDASQERPPPRRSFTRLSLQQQQDLQEEVETLRARHESHIREFQEVSKELYMTSHHLKKAQADLSHFQNTANLAELSLLLQSGGKKSWLTRGGLGSSIHGLTNSTHGRDQNEEDLERICEKLAWRQEGAILVVEQTMYSLEEILAEYVPPTMEQILQRDDDEDADICSQIQPGSDSESQAKNDNDETGDGFAGESQNVDDVEGRMPRLRGLFRNRKSNMHPHSTDGEEGLDSERPDSSESTSNEQISVPSVTNCSTPGSTRSYFRRPWSKTTTSPTKDSNASEEARDPEDSPLTGEREACGTMSTEGESDNNQPSHRLRAMRSMFRPAWSNDSQSEKKDSSVGLETVAESSSSTSPRRQEAPDQVDPTTRLVSELFNTNQQRFADYLSQRVSTDRSDGKQACRRITRFAEFDDLVKKAARQCNDEVKTSPASNDSSVSSQSAHEETAPSSPRKLSENLTLKQGSPRRDTYENEDSDGGDPCVDGDDLEQQWAQTLIA